jgi:hypothetical protein
MLVEGFVMVRAEPKRAAMVQLNCSYYLETLTDRSR